MKKFKILFSLITMTILLASCGSLSDHYAEKYGEDWAESTN